MLSLPLSVLLTAIFAAVGLYCARTWIRSYAARAPAADPLQIVHLNHAAMSVLMIVMVWRPAGQLGSWAQALVFGIFALAQVALLVSTRDRVARGDLISHIVMNVAMVWMLLAMPLLMGHAPSGGADARAHHGGGASSAPMEMIPTPVWATSINMAVISLCVAIGGWWLLRLRRSRTDPIHFLCHALGAAGMALMLALM